MGRIALSQGHLDYVLRRTIKTIADLSLRDGDHATAGLTSRELRSRIRRLARQRLGEGSALLMLEAILERAARATQQRNDLIHSIWAHQSDGKAVIQDGHT